MGEGSDVIHHRGLKSHKNHPPSQQQPGEATNGRQDASMTAQRTYDNN